MTDAEASMMVFFRDKKVLILVPHADDEVNTAGSLLIQLAKYGVKCRVVYSTRGDKYTSEKRRKREALRSLGHVSIRGEDVIFLGFDDFEEEEIRNGEKKIFSAKDALIRVKKIIDEYRPDIIITNDRDDHPNHIELSALTEKALNEVIKDDRRYRPIFLKTYAYDLGYKAVGDYEPYNLQATVKPDIINNPLFVWENRLRLPVPESARTHILEFNEIFKMLAEHHTQGACTHACQVANSDKVFWPVRTDNLAFSSAFTAESGDTDVLSDLRTAYVKNDSSIDTDRIWHPDRCPGSFRMAFDKKKDIGRILVSEAAGPSDNILKGFVELSNGTIIRIDDLHHDGSPSPVFDGRMKDIEWLELMIEETSGERAGIARIQVFEYEPEEIWFLKILNDDNYVYDLYTPQDKVILKAVAFDKNGRPMNLEDDEIRWYTDGREEGSKREITVSLDGRRKCSIRAEYIGKKYKNAVCDTIRIIRCRNLEKKGDRCRRIGRICNKLYFKYDWCVNEVYRIPDLIMKLFGRKS